MLQSFLYFGSLNTTKYLDDLFIYIIPIKNDKIVSKSTKSDSNMVNDCFFQQIIIKIEELSVGNICK